MKKLLSIPLLVFGFISCQSPEPKNSVDQKIDSLLSIMTLEEKIGQLNLPSAGQFTTGQAENSDIAKKIEKGLVGGLFNIKSVAAI